MINWQNRRNHSATQPDGPVHQLAVGAKKFMAKYAANKRYLYEIWKTCYLCCTFDLAGRHCGARCHCPDRHPGIPNAAGRISVLAHPRGRFFSSYYSLIFCIPYNAFRTIYEAPLHVCVCVLLGYTIEISTKLQRHACTRALQVGWDGERVTGKWGFEPQQTMQTELWAVTSFFCVWPLVHKGVYFEMLYCFVPIMPQCMKHVTVAFLDEILNMVFCGLSLGRQVHVGHYAK